MCFKQIGLPISGKSTRDIADQTWYFEVWAGQAESHCRRTPNTTTNKQASSLFRSVYPVSRTGDNKRHGSSTDGQGLVPGDVVRRLVLTDDRAANCSHARRSSCEPPSTSRVDEQVRSGGGLQADSDEGARKLQRSAVPIQGRSSSVARKPVVRCGSQG